MVTRGRGAALVLLALAGAFGCSKDDPRPPLAPMLDAGPRDAQPVDARPVDATTIDAPVSPMDAAPSDSDVDASDATLEASVDAPADAPADARVDGGRDASTDAGPLPSGCEAIPAMSSANTLSLSTGASTELVFAEDRLAQYWDEEACPTARRLNVVFLSGTCELDAAHRFLFDLDGDELGVSITFGAYSLTEFSAIDVRYHRPASAGSGGIWGNCAGSSGTFSFAEVSDLAGGSIRATFDLTLTDCDPTRTLAPIRAQGALDVELVTGLAGACS